MKAETKEDPNAETPAKNETTAELVAEDFGGNAPHPDDCDGNECIDWTQVAAEIRRGRGDAHIGEASHYSGGPAEGEPIANSTAHQQRQDNPPESYASAKKEKQAQINKMIGTIQSRRAARTESARHCPHRIIHPLHPHALATRCCHHPLLLLLQNQIQI